MTEMKFVERILTAVAKAGSPVYVHHCGATLDEIAALLAEGATEEAGWAIIIHANFYRDDRRRLTRALPVLVSNRYWFGHLRLAQPQIARWCEANGDWAEAMRGCASRPPRLAGLIEAQARQIASLAA
ncbi:hypothetical protein [Sphingomonas sp. TX0522]|uniref:hypothetical protein n=1 Tax=Sphingomonas sp. TX0522 TaxID=2479205 RepID=UPI0018E05872|nr:hypothetical protein [Sphingomonas sp. TX0522]